MDPEMELFLNHAGVTKDTSHDQNTINKEKSIISYKGLVFTDVQAFPVKISKRTNSKGFAMLSTNPIIKEINKKHYQDPCQYLNNLKSKLQLLHPPHKPIPVDIYRKVLQEYQEFVNFHIYLEHSNLSPELTNISITYCDEKYRKHNVTIEVNYSSGHLFHIGSCDLPIVIEESDDSLISLYNKYVGTIEALQVFFEVLDELKHQLWIVDPVNPKYSDVSRRIMLDKDLSAVITFDPTYPTALPKVRLLGPMHKVEPVQKAVEMNFELWNDKENVIEELLKLFAIKAFPRKGPEDNENGVGTCCICYEYRGEAGLLPEKFCSNLPCNQCFHTECLYKWLHQTRQYSANEVHGKCPYCKQDISCDI